jgi:CubicO group peptidase (beta-lactamase class C family)
MMKPLMTLLLLGSTCALVLALEPPAKLDDRLKRFDKNGDGKLQKDEVPEALLKLFERIDANKDGFVTPEEAAKLKLPGMGDNKRGSVEVKPDPNNERKHGDEATKAGLDSKVLAKLDALLAAHSDAKNVSGVVVLIHRNGTRGYFESFGFQDIETKKVMPKDAIFRLQSMTKPVIAACALSLYD